MELEERLAKVSTELSPGNLVLETNVQVKVIRPILRSLGWDDADSSHLRAEYKTGYGRADEALLDEFGHPLVFIEAKKQGHLQDVARYDSALRQLFRYARNEPVRILLLTDGEAWDSDLRKAARSPAERRFLRLALAASADLEEAASALRTFLRRDAVLNDDAIRAAQARLVDEKARSERRRDIQIAWRALLDGSDETLRSLLTERIEQGAGHRPPSAEIADFLREQGAHALPEGDPAPGPSRPYTYDELFPDDRPRTDYARDELEHLMPDEMSDVLEWWAEEWEVDAPTEHDCDLGESSQNVEFVLHAQGLYRGWVTAADEIREAAEEFVDVQAYLASLKVVELRDWAVRLGLGTSGLRKQGLVDTLAENIEWLGD